MTIVCVAYNRSCVLSRFKKYFPHHIFYILIIPFLRAKDEICFYSKCAYPFWKTRIIFTFIKHIRKNPRKFYTRENFVVTKNIIKK